MSIKERLLQEARENISSLLKEIKLEQGEKIDVQYKGVYIHLYRTDFFQGVEEYMFNYYEIIDKKIYKYDSFCYNKLEKNMSEKKLVNGYYFDKIPVHYFRKIKMNMNLDNILKDFKALA